MNETIPDPAPETDPDRDPGHYHLRLYVAGQTAKSLAAMTNLKRFCEQHLAGRYDIEVIDLMKNPQLAAGDQILAIPTLVRRLPSPLRRISLERFRQGTQPRGALLPEALRCRHSPAVAPRGGVPPADL